MAVTVGVKHEKGSLVPAAALVILPVITIILSFLFGRYPVTPGQLFTVLFESLFRLKHSLPEQLYIVILNVRLPRIMTAAVAGAALSASGAAYQGMFRNPMASPDLLGASAGASFGAALAITLSFGIFGIELLAFGFGLAAVLLAYLVSIRTRSGSSPFTLILSGILIGTLFSSFITLIKYTADPFGKLPAITYWLMGSLSSVNLNDFILVSLISLISLIPLFLFRWKLNILSFDSDEAAALGVNVRKLRVIVVLCSTMMTASVVSAAGLIGWIGLVVPHIARMTAGPDFRRLLPAAVSIGASFLLLTDNIARCTGSMEIPLGALTSIIGAPFFIYLLIRKGGSQ